MVRASKSEAWLRQKESCSAVLSEMRRTLFLTDVVLVCENKEFRAHRSYLCASSPFLLQQFQGAQQQRNNTNGGVGGVGGGGGGGAACNTDSFGRLEVKDVTAHAMQVVLDFAYNGQIPDIKLSHLGEMQEVLHASQVLQVRPLLDYCVRVCVDILGGDNLLEQWTMAESLRSEALLLQPLLRKVVLNFGHFRSHRSFRRLSEAQLERLLRHPFQQADPLDGVVDGVIAWTRDQPDRSAKLDKVLSWLDLSRTSTGYLHALLNSEPLVRGNCDLYERLLELATARAERLPPRAWVVLWWTSADGHEVALFDVAERKLSSPNELPFKYTPSMAVASCGGRVYFSGGDRCELKRTVYQYSPLRNSVQLVGTLDQPVCCAGSGVHNGLLYVVGGEPVATHGRVVHRINLSSGESERLADTNLPHVAPYVFSHGGHVYALGTCGASCYAVEWYDAFADQWSLMSRPLPCCEEGAVATVYGDHGVLVMTEEEDDADEAPRFRLYDPSANVWRVASGLCGGGGGGGGGSGSGCRGMSVYGCWSVGGDDLVTWDASRKCLRLHRSGGDGWRELATFPKISNCCYAHVIVS